MQVISRFGLKILFDGYLITPKENLLKAENCCKNAVFLFDGYLTKKTRKKILCSNKKKTKLSNKDRTEKICMNPKDSNIYNKEETKKHTTPLGVE